MNLLTYINSDINRGGQPPKQYNISMKQVSKTTRSIEFNRAFRNVPSASTLCDESCDNTYFHGSCYLHKVEFVSIAKDYDSEYMVYINNPHCPVDANGYPIFSEKHPQQQWVFGYYKSWKRALNKALSIATKALYPKPIEVWY